MNTGFNTYRVTLENSEGVLTTELLISDNKRNAAVTALATLKDGHDFIPIDIMLTQDTNSIKYIKGEEHE